MEKERDERIDILRKKRIFKCDVDVKKMNETKQRYIR